MSHTARRIAALLSAVAMVLGVAAAATTVESGTANAGSCCTTKR
jgi:hypothetical protein